MRPLLSVISAPSKAEDTVGGVFLSVASGYSITGQLTAPAEIALAYSLEEIGHLRLPRKHLFLCYRKGKDKGTEHFTNAVRYISLMCATAPMASTTVWHVFPGPLREASAPPIVRYAHDIVKKNSPTAFYDEVKDFLGQAVLRVPVGNDMELAFVSGLTLAAITAGAHRLGLALRQICGQLIAYALLRGRGKSKALPALLSALAADTYIWYPLICGFHKARTLRGELYASLLGEDVGRLSEALSDGELFYGRLLCLARGLLNELPVVAAQGRGIIDGAIRLSDAMRFEIRTALGVEQARELILGLFIHRLLPALRRLQDEPFFGEGEEVGLLISATEQLGPGLLRLLIEGIREVGGLEVRSVCVLYTPATFINRLLTDEYAKTCEDELLRSVRWLPVGATNPELAYRVARGALKDIGKKGIKALVVGLGHMAVMASLVRACYGLEHVKLLLP